MTEKRFTLDNEENGLCKCILMNGDEIPTCEVVELLNELHEENEQLKQSFKEILKDLEVSTFNKELLEKENEQLKQTMHEVAELLSEEIDLFSDKATEHDIIAYTELCKLDNKDAYYMATATKKAIKLLKGDVE